MKNFEILSLNHALAALEGYTKKIPDPKHPGASIDEFTPYDFTPKGNNCISTNLSILAEPARVLMQTRFRIVRGFLRPNEKSIPSNDPRIEEFKKQWIEILNEESPAPIRLYRVPRAEFKLDTNPIPLLVRRGLDPIFSDEISQPVDDFPTSVSSPMGNGRMQEPGSCGSPGSGRESLGGN